MGTDATHVRATLAAWREQRADRMDPLRFGFIEALASRADAHGGAARRLLDARLSGLIDAYAQDLRSASAAGAEDAAAVARLPARGALAGLLEHMTPPAVVDDSAMSAAGLPSSAYPELPVLDEFRRIWTRVRTSSQLRQTLEQMPADAGPLNSGVLVHRAIALMRALSPGYLQHFIAYVDTLSSLQGMRDGNASMGTDTPRGEVAKKAGRTARPRKRRA